MREKIGQMKLKSVRNPFRPCGVSSLGMTLKTLSSQLTYCHW